MYIVRPHLPKQRAPQIYSPLEPVLFSEILAVFENLKEVSQGDNEVPQSE